MNESVEFPVLDTSVLEGYTNRPEGNIAHYVVLQAANDLTEYDGVVKRIEKAIRKANSCRSSAPLRRLLRKHRVATINGLHCQLATARETLDSAREFFFTKFGERYLDYAGLDGEAVRCELARHHDWARKMYDCVLAKRATRMAA